MFVRKKTNRSGTTSVVVVSKAHGKFVKVKKFGVAKSEEEADVLYRRAKRGCALMTDNKSLTSTTAGARR